MTNMYVRKLCFCRQAGRKTREARVVDVSIKTCKVVLEKSYPWMR